MNKSFGRDSVEFSQCISSIVAELIKTYRSTGKVLELGPLKTKYSCKYHLSNAPRTSDIVLAVPEEYSSSFFPKIRAKPVRTAAGVAVVAVMCKPHRCPHIERTGKACIYCPGGMDSDFEYSSQSYTGYEPTSMRAIRARYDPFVQARSRLEQLKGLGHDIDKVEYIIMGGTFLNLPPSYRRYFIQRLFDACSGHTSCNVPESIRYAEESSTKCVALCVETRPDFCLPPHLSELLDYGCTRLELGVQTIFDDVTRKTGRGHSTKDVIRAFRLCREGGFKVIAHMMPDLPGVDFKRDIQCFQEFFSNPDFRSDGLKLYPTLVMRGTELYEMWKLKKYQNYDPNTLVLLLAQLLALVPPWVRVYRIQRDIPMPLVTSGVDWGNLRELVMKKSEELNLPCWDIRSREVGIKKIHHNNIKPTDVELFRRDYTANNGWETFLSYEDQEQNILVGLLRLRKCNPMYSYRPELGENVSLIRELHVYGTVVPIHQRNLLQFQHQGYGKLLMEEAEKIAREEHCSKKIAVISGIGTRKYYRNLGYQLDGPYMSKIL